MVVLIKLLRAVLDGSYWIVAATTIAAIAVLSMLAGFLTLASELPNREILSVIFTTGAFVIGFGVLGYGLHMFNGEGSWKRKFTVTSFCTTLTGLVVSLGDIDLFDLHFIDTLFQGDSLPPLVLILSLIALTAWLHHGKSLAARWEESARKKQRMRARQALRNKPTSF